METDQKRREGFPGQRLVVLPSPIVARAMGLPAVSWLLPTHLGRFDHARHHQVVRPEGCADHVFMLCLDGAGTVVLANRPTEIRAGDAVLLPPDTAHSYGADESAPWTILWFHFTGTGSAAHRAMLLGDTEDPVFRIRDPGVLVEAFEETFRHVLGGFTDGDLFALSTSFSRFLGLCRVHQQSRDGRRRETEERVLKVIHHMRENLHRPLELEELARAAGWAPSHFSAVFRRQTNASPLAFLTRLRMQRACELLRCTDEPITAVAAASGLDDAFYFSRLFRRQIGMPPSLYRRTYGPSASTPG